VKPKPPKLGAKLQVIWFSVWLSACSVCVIVLPKVLVILLAACWLAKTPAGIETRIAKENPKAIITNKARIFLREIFLTARLNIPTFTPFQFIVKRQSERERRGIFWAVIWAYGLS
jgi:hypothetical protein